MLDVGANVGAWADVVLAVTGAERVDPFLAVLRQKLAPARKEVWGMIWAR